MSIFLHQAIRAVHTNAININGDTQETITAWDNDGNNVAITNWETINTKATELETSFNSKEAQKVTDKANGNQKLLDLGLTQAEATALTGYTPPVEE